MRRRTHSRDVQNVERPSRRRALRRRSAKAPTGASARTAPAKPDDDASAQRSRGASAGAAPDPAAPAIELRDASKTYPGSPPVRALDQVSVQIDRGEMVAVVGQSGSGKSTMLNVMGTLDQPTSGSVLIEGIDTSSLHDDQLAAIRGRRVGFVFQRFFLLAGVSVIDNVANGLLYTGEPRAQRREAALTVLDRVGLSPRVHHRPDELSGGEMQRVAVARALVHQPAFVLADEPTGNLDSASSNSIVDLLFSLHEEGRTLVVVTHNEAIAEALPRQLHILDGQVVRDSSAPAP